MSIWELTVLAIGLAMDAFAVSIGKGLASGRVGLRHMAAAGGWFGGFQMLMPLLGYLLGAAFGNAIRDYDHWVAFVLLGLIGGNMIKESFSKSEGDPTADGSFGFRAMLLPAVATSIDALAVGVTFALLPNVNLWLAVGVIGAITFAVSAAGVKIGSVFGGRFKTKARLAGGVLLILTGVKILLEHLGVLAF